MTNSKGGEIWTAPTIEQLQGLLAGYHVLEILGQGGMGAVYKARQESLGRLVAIKVLPPPDDETDALNSKKRFENEAHTMARMNHPGIVSIFDFGRTADGQFCFFVMEFVDGTDLSQAIHGSKKLQQEEAVKIVTEVCAALHYAHDNGIIHRDVKPANILISAEGQIKIADFGLARMIDPLRIPERGLTASNVALGTPDFVAPEVLSLQESDARSDIYSVGVMLYQMLTGEIPRGMFKMPSQKKPGLDARFDEIICKAMEPDPADRFQSTQEITLALETIRTVPLKPAAATAKSRRHLVIVFLAGLTALIVWIGVSSLKDRDESAPPKKPTPVAGEWKNLLPALGENPQGLDGSKWLMVSGELHTPKSALYSHQTLEIPIDDPPSEYDLRVQFTRHSGEAAIIAAFRYGNAGGYFYVDSWTGTARDYRAGISKIMRHKEGASTINEGVFTRNGVVHEVRLHVRHDRVTATLDGREITNWRAHWGEIAQKQAAGEGAFFPAGTVDHPIFGVGTCSSAATFHSFEIKTIDGEPVKVMPPPVEPADHVLAVRPMLELPDDGWTDLLGGLDVEKYSLMDTWRLENGELQTPVDNFTHQTIELPVENPPANYDLRVELTRHSGIAAVSVGFRHEDAAGSIFFDGLESNSFTRKAEIYDIRDVKATTNDMFLKVGQRHTVVLQVRDESVTLGLDGEVLFKWPAKWHRLRQTEGFFFPSSLQRPIMALGACATEVTFHKVELRSAEEPEK
jgi:serine/threonine protein kinase